MGEICLQIFYRRKKVTSSLFTVSQSYVKQRSDTCTASDSQGTPCGLAGQFTGLKYLFASMQNYPGTCLCKPFYGYSNTHTHTLGSQSVQCRPSQRLLSPFFLFFPMCTGFTCFCLYDCQNFILRRPAFSPLEADILFRTARLLYSPMTIQLQYIAH